MMHRLAEGVQGLWKKSPTARNLTKVYAGDVLSKVVGVGSALILIRGLRVSDYASLVAFNSVANLSAGLAGNGINTALVRFSAEHLSHTARRPRALYVTAFLAEIVLFALLLLACLLFPGKAASLVLGQATLVKPLLLGILYGLGLLLLQIGRCIHQAEERFNLYVGILWLRQGLTLVLVTGLWLTRVLSFEAAAWLLAVLHIVIGVGVVLHSAGAGRFIDLRSLVREDRDLTRGFFSATGWLIAYCLSVAAFSQMDVLMLSRLASRDELAVYGVAFQYYSMALLLLGSVHAVLLPKFSHVEMQEPSRQRAFLARWLRYSVWTGVPILAFDILGKPAFVWINGPQYERSFNVLVVLSVGVWLSLMFSPLVNALISRGHLHFLFAAGVCALIFSGVANYVWVPAWGSLGAAMVTVLTHNIVLQVPILWRVWKW